MKTRITLFIMLLICASNFAQEKKEKTKDSTKANSENLLDMQTNILTSMLGEDLDGTSEKKPIGFLELLDKMDLPPKQKAEYVNLYYLQSKDMTKKTKDSLERALKKKLLEAQKDN